MNIYCTICRARRHVLNDRCTGCNSLASDCQGPPPGPNYPQCPKCNGGTFNGSCGLRECRSCGETLSMPVEPPRPSSLLVLGPDAGKRERARGRRLERMRRGEL